MIATLYTILKNSVVAHETPTPIGASFKYRMTIDDALTLLGATRQVYPEVTHIINAAIDRARES
jgi:hypothetical protein